ncbi:uncharacterized protein LOC119829815 isoform X2 [Zerene cesonia]|uniref:uncharacterized protein LOC119829815 isoform X2 n=1 Tax=Zerene cesonia TaxID=33412 RepID=UPI0018E50D0D|nr:uncharacterized protein LOC119829815 isoform X2 [Zerene cesonia]
MSSLRYFSAGALFTLVILTECFGAHDRSRQRSGPIRSVPVAASVKREVDFDCPEEFGYYPHPTDCTLYYVCVFGGALLESCTGGLMYSHELQTCDWPRNVGCDATGAVVAEDLERLNEREPPPPPQLRRNPPPPPRVQPNPIVTSRGQPKYSRREEYEKQQQLYAEVEDQLPPVEEIETDRQQRVYRGQPSTIGQVQKDRDGYAAQPISSGRTLNANIIPASINQNSKIGSFSFGTQVDERRAPTATPAPQTYSGRTHDNVTETSDRLLDFMTNEIETDEIREKIHSRRKRGIVDSTSDSNSKNNSYIVDRNDNDETMEYIEDDTESILDYNDEQFENERGKRQVRYYTKNGYKTPTKSWPNTKQLKYVDLQQYNYNPNIQSSRYQQVYTNDDLSNAQRASSASSNYFPTGNSYLSYQTDNFQSQRPFKPSLPDIPKQKQSPTNINTQIITKSPPISSLHNNDNPFSSLSGGFYNNNQNNQNKFHNFNQNGQYLYQTVTPKYPSYPDSSQLSSTLVTGKPIQATSTITPGKYHSNYQIANGQQNKFSNINDQNTVNIRPPKANEEYDDEDEESDEDEDESEEGTNDKRTNFGPISSHIPHDYKYPKNKYANIDNPFASPDFNFDDFLSKLRDSHYSVVGITTNKPKLLHTDGFSSTPVQNHRLTFPTSPTYKVISTPKPFTPSTHLGVVHSSTLQPQQFHQSFISQNNQHAKIKPPNFKDDRQLPLTHNFNTPFQNNINESRSTSPKIQAQYLQEVTQKPFFTVTGPNALLSSTRNTNFLNHPSPFVSSENPFVTSTIKPNHPYVVTYKQSTPKPSTTLASQQLAALQHYWNNPSTEYSQFLKSTLRPNYVSDIPNLESLFKQSFRPSPQVITRAPETVRNPVITTTSTTTTTTTVAPPKRKPIPKPSPEMIDYYYDDEDDQYYYEPAVKPKYMPSSEVKPQRPPMAQNYQEYDDLNENKVNAPETTVLSRPPPRRPINYNSYQHDSVTKNHNDVSDITKTPFKQSLKNINGKIPVPVMMDFVTPNGMRPELNDISMIHHVSRNRTVHIRKPMNNDNPYTLRPPKYLNQTTLRPYTVRHRLAKPTSVKDTLSQSDDTRQTRGKIRHHNIVAEMKLTTPSDSLRQETRYTKTSHDDKTNSLEPTESVTPSSYSASPRPKMLYNGSQSYIPDQYDPYYAVYDEDGELYKDTDYEQQYNTASLRPAVQQTYRGTPPPPPPPARRPVETYTPRPVLPDDYDDALIQGQISNQNQYQPSIRQQTRLSTDENSFRESDPTESYKSFNESQTTVPPTLSPVINLSSLAKPFEKTGNSNRLSNDVSSTTTTTTNSPTRRTSPRTTSSKKNIVEIVHSDSNKTNKKMISLTTGFSIRRNINDTNNPYTVTVYRTPQNSRNSDSKKHDIQRYYYYDLNKNSDTLKKNEDVFNNDQSSSTRRNDASVDVEEVTKYKKPLNKVTSTSKPRILITTTPSPTDSTKYYLKTVLKRPAQQLTKFENIDQSTENNIKNDEPIESELEDINNDYIFSPLESSTEKINDQLYTANRQWDKPVISPYETLNNLRNKETDQDLDYISTSTTTSSTTTIAPRQYLDRYVTEKHSPRKSSYYTYRVADDDVLDQTTEMFNGRVKNIIKTFFNSLQSTPIIETSSHFSSSPRNEEIVNIGFQKKKVKYADEKPVRNNIKYVQIITEPVAIAEIAPTYTTVAEVVKESEDPSITTSTLNPSTTLVQFPQDQQTPPTILESSTINDFVNIQKPTTYESKFSKLVTNKPHTEKSRKYSKIITTKEPSTVYPNSSPSNEYQYEPTSELNKPTDISSTTPDELQPIIVSDIASTTSTTKSTTTIKTEYDSTSTKSTLPFPTRVSRVNPAIKLAAKSLGGGRRSYQSPPNCSTDNRLQANPKCNEIKYQRPSSTRGRGSAHYSTSGGSETSQQTPNRGTPPTRSRPTLKPSTAIVSKTSESVDIYTNPPKRPSPVYPQPTPDKTAAKCRKDVCLLPDCFCGGKDIPGNLPADEVPQIVLVTFDDAVNDLNKMYYEELFERGRVNPNGCPITATFYVSHEWTDYSQIQNLYADGHEFASHTISHSFGEQFSQKKWNREVGGQREILAAYGGVKLEDVRGMRAPFLSVGGNKMFKMLYDSNFTYDSSLPVYENRPPSWPYTLDYKLFHDCMIPPCPTKSYPGVWEVPMVMWQDLNGGRCSMGDACANPPDAEGVYKMILKNFDRHYTTNRAPFGLFYHAAWFTQPHHKAGFIMFLDFINKMKDVWIVTNWQAIQWVRDPTPISRLNNFQPFQCNYQDRPKKCNNPKVCNLWHKSGVRYMRTCQPCPEIYPWTGKTGIRSSRIDNEIEEK